MRFCSECGEEVLSGSLPMRPAQLQQADRQPNPAATPHSAGAITEARPRLAARGNVADVTSKSANPRTYPDTRVFPTTIAFVLVALLAGSAVTWLMLRSKDEPGSGSAPETAAMTPSTALPARTAERRTSTSIPPTSSLSESDVIAALEAWASALDAHDLNMHMSYFADTLDTYYSRRNVGVAKVRADLQRAFSRYSTLNVRLNGIRVTLNRSDESASVTLDKSWTFAQGPDTASGQTWAGSVRQMLWLRRIEGNWRITGLKDL